MTPDASGQIYDGLQVRIQHRFSQNLSANAAYTFSRLKDSETSPNNPFNLAGE